MNSDKRPIAKFAFPNLDAGALARPVLADGAAGLGQLWENVSEVLRNQTFNFRNREDGQSETLEAAGQWPMLASSLSCGDAGANREALSIVKRAKRRCVKET